MDFQHHRLREIGLLDTDDAGPFDNLTTLASRVLGAPVSLVSIIDEAEDRQYFKSAIGLGEPWASQRQTPLSHSFCQHVAKTNAPLIVDDARIHETVKSNLAIPDLGVIGYLGVPIHSPDQKPIGALCVIEPKVREWSDDDLNTMVDFARVVDDAIRALAKVRLSESFRIEQRETIVALAHDIRGPIRTVRMLLGTLGELYRSGNEKTLEQFLESAIDATDRLQNMTKGFLEYASVLNDPAELESIDLNSLIDGVFNDLESLRHEVRGELRRDELPQITGSRSQIYFLFINLIQNALKFRKEGVTPIVEVSAEMSDDHVKIHVRDNGIGIEKDYHGQIFDLFQRLNSAEIYEGSGIGLASCLRIVQNAGGVISVQSEPGNGSTFTVSIPISKHSFD